jgi:hypothetical protein
MSSASGSDFDLQNDKRGSERHDGAAREHAIVNYTARRKRHREKRR